MTAARFHLSREQVFTNAGLPAAGAKLFFYTTGTLTALATYSNAALSTLNSNPVVADSNGRFGDIFLQDQTYRVIMRDSTEATTFFDTDPVYKDVTFIRAAGLPAVSFPNMLVHNTSDGKKYRRNSSGSGWIDEGPIDSVGNTAGVADVVAGTSTSLFATPDAIAGLWERGADIASATTVTVPVGGGGYFEVTGTTTITAINSQRSGLELELRFQSALTLTNSGSFALLDGADMLVEAGSVARFRNVSTVGTSGTSWRMVSYVRPSRIVAASIASKTGNYTATTADQGKSIRFAGLSADATLTLPSAASCGNGFVLWVSNEDTADATPWGVTVDANASELIDGVSTRKMYTGTRVCLMCDGTGWRTVHGQWRYFSGNQTISAANSLTLPHGLGVRPKNVWMEIICTTAEAGFSIGDIYPFSLLSCDGVTVYNHNAAVDATNLNVRQPSTAAWPISNKTTGAYVAMTAANWRARYYAHD
jgi:hypothetical protein